MQVWAGALERQGRARPIQAQSRRSCAPDLLEPIRTPQLPPSHRREIRRTSSQPTIRQPQQLEPGRSMSFGQAAQNLALSRTDVRTDDDDDSENMPRERGNDPSSSSKGKTKSRFDETSSSEDEVLVRPRFIKFGARKTSRTVSSLVAP
jgi:hypothetical protein